MSARDLWEEESVVTHGDECSESMGRGKRGHLR
jgi:hypothetical protein